MLNSKLSDMPCRPIFSLLLNAHAENAVLHRSRGIEPTSSYAGHPYMRMRMSLTKFTIWYCVHKFWTPIFVAYTYS